MLSHNQLESIFHKPKYQMNEEEAINILMMNERFVSPRSIVYKTHTTLRGADKYLNNMNQEEKEKIIAYNIELKKQQYFYLLKKAQKKAQK